MLKTVLRIAINMYKLIACVGFTLIVCWKVLKKSGPELNGSSGQISLGRSIFGEETLENSTGITPEILQEIEEELREEFQEDIEEELDVDTETLNLLEIAKIRKIMPTRIKLPILDIPSGSLSEITDAIFKEANFFENTDEFKGFNDNFGGDICEKSVITIVSGHPDNFERRKLIRKTWSQPNMAILFIVGSPEQEINKIDPQKLKVWEFEKSGDIIKLNYTESYDLLTVKTIASFEFIQKLCENKPLVSSPSPWLVHIDDDMFFNTSSFLSQLPTISKTRDRIYCLDKILQSKGFGTKPHRGGKYKISFEEYAKERFPIACSGTAFAVRRDLVEKMSPFFRSEKVIRLEDVYVTGIVREAAGLPNPVVLRPKVVEHFKGDDEKMERMFDVET